MVLLRRHSQDMDPRHYSSQPHNSLSSKSYTYRHSTIAPYPSIYVLPKLQHFANWHLRQITHLTKSDDTPHNTLDLDLPLKELIPS